MRRTQHSHGQCAQTQASLAQRLFQHYSGHKMALAYRNIFALVLDQLVCVRYRLVSDRLRYETISFESSTYFSSRNSIHLIRQMFYNCLAHGDLKTAGQDSSNKLNNSHESSQEFHSTGNLTDRTIHESEQKPHESEQKPPCVYGMLYLP